MKSVGKKFIVVGVGIGIMVAGVISWFLPLAPGTLLVVLGLLVVATQWHWLDDQLEKRNDQWLKRYPNMQQRVRGVRRKINSFFN